MIVMLNTFCYRIIFVKENDQSEKVPLIRVLLSNYGLYKGSDGSFNDIVKLEIV